MLTSRSIKSYKFTNIIETTAIGRESLPNFASLFGLVTLAKWRYISGIKFLDGFYWWDSIDSSELLFFNIF